jgi:hypothetical protein
MKKISLFLVLGLAIGAIVFCSGFYLGSKRSRFHSLRVDSLLRDNVLLEYSLNSLNQRRAIIDTANMKLSLRVGALELSMKKSDVVYVSSLQRIKYLPMDSVVIAVDKCLNDEKDNR